MIYFYLMSGLLFCYMKVLLHKIEAFWPGDWHYKLFFLLVQILRFVFFYLERSRKTCLWIVFFETINKMKDVIICKQGQVVSMQGPERTQNLM